MGKTILFDLDGTLIDSTEAILEAFDGACEDLGCEKYPHKEIKKLIGYPLDLMFQTLNGGIIDKWEFVEAYKLRYRPISKPKTTLLKGASQAVELASTFARCAVVTTKTALYSEELLEHLGIGHHFETLIGRDSVDNPKPHPEPINKALEFMQIKADHNCWMIGDTKLDLLSAQSAKICHAGVLCGYSSQEELSKYTKNIFVDAYEAVEFIKSR